MEHDPLGQADGRLLEIRAREGYREQPKRGLDLQQFGIIAYDLLSVIRQETVVPVHLGHDLLRACGSGVRLLVQQPVIADAFEFYELYIVLVVQPYQVDTQDVVLDLRAFGAGIRESEGELGVDVA